ncbi:MAG: ABC transporter permease [Methanobacterium sp.]
MDIIQILQDSYHVMIKDMIEFKRNRFEVAGLIAFPLIFLLLFGFIFPSGNTHENVQMGLVNLDQGAGSNEFITQMETMNKQLATTKNSSYMSFNNYSSVDAAKTAINKGTINGAFVIPPGFSSNVTSGQPGNVIVIVDNSNPTVAGTIEQVSSSTIGGLNGISANTNVLKLGSEANQQINPQAIIAPYVQNIETTIPGESNYFNFLAPGLIVMIGMMYIMNGVPETISKEKEKGTFDGMLSAPIHHISIILGKTMGLTIRGVVQCLFVLIFAVLLFGVTVQGNLLLVFFMIILGIFSFIGIGIMAVSLAEDQATAAMIMDFIMFPMIFLAGVIFPVQQMPWFMQDISKVIPLTYAGDAMRKIMLLNANVADVSTDIIILLAFGVITMLIALPLFRRGMKD